MTSESKTNLSVSGSVMVSTLIGLLLAGCSSTPVQTGTISGTLSLGISAQSNPLASALSTQAMPTSASSLAEIIPGRLILKYKSGIRVQSLGPLAAQINGVSVGLKLERTLAVAGTQLLRADGINATKTLEVARQLSSRSDIEYAEPDRRIHALALPNDPNYNLQWALGSSAAGRINAPTAWATINAASGLSHPVIAVVDSGVMLAHPDLSAQLLPGYDFVSDPGIANDGGGRDANPDDPGDADPSIPITSSLYLPSSYHGTHVAGIAAAGTDNGIGVSGVAAGAKILPVRVLGVGGGAVSDMIDAVLWSAGIDIAGVPHNANRADVINLSLGGAGQCSRAEQDAFNLVTAAGTAVVVASGNENADAWDTDPASCAGVIVVGAVGRDGTRAAYSNYGSRVTVLAPGGDQGSTNGAPNGILSTIKTGSGTAGYAYLVGTSMATPHVAGVIALIRSLRPKLSPAQLEDFLKTNSHPVSCSGQAVCGSGLIDAGLAVNAVNASSLTTPADFALQTTASVIYGSSLSVNAVGFNGFSGPVKLSVIGVDGITGNFNTSSLNVTSGASPSSILTLALGSASSGGHLIHLVGTAGSVSRSIPVLVQIAGSASLQGTLVQACYLSGNQCDASKSVVQRITATGLEAPFVFDHLPAGQYVIRASDDLNGDGGLQVGDLYGESGLTTPASASSASVRLEKLTVSTASAPGSRGPIR